MKERIHVTLESETMEELDKISHKTKVAKSVILDMIIKDGIEKIKSINYNFTKFIEKFEE